LPAADGFTRVSVRATHWLHNQINIGLFLEPLLGICHMVRGHSLQDGGLALYEDAAGEHVLEAGGRHYVGGDMLSALKMFIFSHIM
jgi:hypothetical protein